MQLISCHDGKLVKIGAIAPEEAVADGVFTGMAAFDRLMPAGGLARGAVHELLYMPKHPRPSFVAAMLAKKASPRMGGDLKAGVGKGAGEGKESLLPIVWCDPERHVFPPALGISFEQLYLLCPKDSDDTLWAVCECLASKGVGAVVASLDRLSRIQARRLQLAAEKGGAVGFILRRNHGGSAIHAATTRWLIKPVRGGRLLQRWEIQLIHGHGGLTHQPIYLEKCRETLRLSATAELAGDTPAAGTKKQLSIAG